MVDDTPGALTRLRDLVRADPGRFTNSFFTRLFALDPTARELFPASLGHVRHGFYRVIDLVLEVTPTSSGHAELIDLLAQLGRDHRKYGVTGHHYDLARTALVAEFASLLGPAWTRPVATAVDQTVALITGVMSQAADRDTGPAVTRARVTEKFQIGREHAVIRLLAERPLTYLPGQFVEVQIPQWPREWRMLSPSIPANPAGEVEFHVRAIEGGTVSKSIVVETHVDDEWAIAQHHGTMRVEPTTPTTMVAGGTGIAPLRSILLDMCTQVTNPPVHLYYGARHPGELYELPNLQRMASMNPWLQITAVTEKRDDPWWLPSIAPPTELGFPHMIGTLADAVIHDARSVPDHWEDRDVLVAGSPQMIEVTRRKLLIVGARASRIQHDEV
ncbi:globin domain-containing protein [Gordonia crocea]|uniref:nitric oxide dioxygenase n=1 Tax=Gordonia crocea TaxID=589162 RepID=A0A7I9V277_9ACTN|nr:globin domain-containing protein [Gordonia crocea]GED99180.1 flavohemoprotein [Gordonia crocea]